MRRILVAIGLVGLVAALAIGLSQSGGEGGEPASRAASASEQQRALAGAPAPLARLHAQANALLPGGPEAFERRLAELRGHPVVVNKWASWCGPCRAEFPFFQSLAVKLGREVAFVGLNSGDSRDDARAFLRRFPVPYPSYVDPDERIARAVKAPANYPITLYYDRTGRLAFIHQGGYNTEATLAADVRRYAIGS